MQLHKHINPSKLIILALTTMLSGISFSSCKEKEVEIVDSKYDPEVIPTVKTHNDTIYMSDSGIVKYKVIAKTNLMYDQAKEPYSLFPEGAYLEQYDSLLNIITTVRADSVWQYTNQDLWKLRGNVNIVNIEGKSFDSNELFWDQKRGKIYSNLYVTIREPNKATLRAQKFESNQEMTEYTFTDAENVDLYIQENDENEEEVTE